MAERLTYANVVATLALFLALGGGGVWAANKITSKQIGKGAVKSKNLAKAAVKSRNLAKSAVRARNLARRSVTTAKIANGAVRNAQLGDGAVSFAKVAPGTNVIASATAGPVPVDQLGSIDVPLNPPVVFTPAAGQLNKLSIEARGTLAQKAAGECSVFFWPSVNGNLMMVSELLMLRAPDDEPDPLAPNGLPLAGITLPIGLTGPGVAQSVTLQLFGDPDCTAGSAVDQVAVVVTQAK